MNTFEMYDLFRLKKFKNNKPQIDFEVKKAFTFFLFDEVTYFNYIFFKTKSYDNGHLIQTLINFRKSGRESIKIIFPMAYRDDYLKLIDNKAPLNEIVCVKRVFLNGDTVNGSVGLLKKVVSRSELKLFTELYLIGFDSENKDIEGVASNFKHLLDSEQIEFFFIIHAGAIAGVCASHYGEVHVFLAACAILPAYRSKGLQVKAINARLKRGRERRYSTFHSWAYSDGASHKNLLKSNFLNHSKYGECVSKPLEIIIAASR